MAGRALRLAAPWITSDGMRVIAHRLIFLMAVLAFAVGLPLALAVPPALAAAEPYLHEDCEMMGSHARDHRHPKPSGKQQHRHNAAGCLCGCVGIGIAMSDLARATIMAPYAMILVVYPETASMLASRSLRPDPAPPEPARTTNPALQATGFFGPA